MKHIAIIGTGNGTGRVIMHQIHHAHDIIDCIDVNDSRLQQLSASFPPLESHNPTLESLAKKLAVELLKQLHNLANQFKTTLHNDYPTLFYSHQWMLSVYMQKHTLILRNQNKLLIVRKKQISLERGSLPPPKNKASVKTEVF